MSKLERLELYTCKRYLFTKKLHLKELTLWNDAEEDEEFEITAEIIDSLFNKTLCKLSLNCAFTPEAAKVIRESCPNLKFLEITIDSKRFLSSTTPPICELSLK